MAVSLAAVAHAASPIGQALSCGKVGLAGGLAAGTDMTRVVIDTNRFPDALVFAPQCTNHESLTDDTAFFNVRVNGLSFHDTLWNWWSGAQPQTAIHPFTPPSGAAAGCPAE